ncbi:MAG: hypothetical protein KAX87_08210, partial [Nitrospira sp.]|nr:hypothetical protein [Nitrospira sp.]
MHRQLVTAVGIFLYPFRGVSLFQESCFVLRAFLRHAAGSLYHIVIVAMSAGIALLLPAGAGRFLS